jgi:urease accessory protein UreF
MAEMKAGQEQMRAEIKPHQEKVEPKMDSNEEEMKTQMCSFASWVDVNQAKSETNQKRLEARL